MKTLVYGSSIKGNGHFVSGVECQDSNSFSELDFTDDEIKVVALSDGHGGAPYCRSSQGSRFAVDIAKKELYAFVSKIKDALDEIDSVQHIINTPPAQFVVKVGEKKEPLKISSEISLLKLRLQNLEKRINIELDSVKEAIVKAWNKAVDEAFASDPLEVIEADILKFDSITEDPVLSSHVGYGTASGNVIRFANRDLGKNILENLEKNPRQVYGATLLALAQYKDHIFILQIGDGDVTVVDCDNHIDNPIKKGEHLIGNETDSLCQKAALMRFNSIYLRRKIKIAMLSTDGIANALEDETGLEAIALGLYESIEEEPAEFRSEFKPFLRRFSSGSTDDCTICFIANGISDEAYETIKATKEVEEEHNLNSTRRSLFESYTLNRDLYMLSESVEKKNPIVSDIKFTKIGMTAIQKSFMKEQYVDLIESSKQLDAMTWQRLLLLDILAYGKKYLSEKENALKIAQEDAYRKAIDELLSINPLRLIRFKVTTIELNSKGAIKLHKPDEHIGIVIAVNDSTMEITTVTQSVYNQICDDFKSLVTFIGHLTITEQYKLSINKYDLMLKKEN